MESDNANPLEVSEGMLEISQSFGQFWLRVIYVYTVYQKVRTVLRIIGIQKYFLAINCSSDRFPPSETYSFWYNSLSFVSRSSCSVSGLFLEEACLLSVGWYFILGNRNDGTGSKGIGAQWLRLHPLFFCIIYLDFFFNTDTGQMNILGIPHVFLLYDLASVATFWLQSRACGYLGGRSWLCSGVALSKSLEASFLMRAWEREFYSSFSTSTKNPWFCVH